MTGTAVRCGVCRRLIGYNVGSKQVPPVRCTSPLCGVQRPVRPYAARDDVLFLLHRLGRSSAYLASLFGLTRQRVDQIVTPKSDD